MLRQAWTGGRPVSSICTDRTDFEMLKAYRTNVLKVILLGSNKHKKETLKIYEQKTRMINTLQTIWLLKTDRVTYKGVPLLKMQVCNMCCLLTYTIVI